MFNIDSEQIKELLVKHYPFLELDWMTTPQDAEWYDGTEFIGALKLDGGKWEFYTLEIKCDEDQFELVDLDGEHFGAWEINDFEMIAIQSGGLYIDHGEEPFIFGSPASLHMN